MPPPTPGAPRLPSAPAPAHAPPRCAALRSPTTCASYPSDDGFEIVARLQPPAHVVAARTSTIGKRTGPQATGGTRWVATRPDLTRIRGKRHRNPRRQVAI